jgi:HPt (histidine-containing phosphotransfer) domain-containing protein
VTDERTAVDNRVLIELRESVGGDQEFVAELIDEFMEDAPRQLRTLREAATAGDADAARRAAHTLKSNARTFGAGELALSCQEAEAAALKGDLGAVRPRVDAIGEELDRVLAELVGFRDGNA